ncbi:MAG TPA: ABC transporter substrate-binding protein [Coriobacteriia bacterium]|nr:ABC transporter substrate-binding protein [Coriobacteriia bacterium]
MNSKVRRLVPAFALLLSIVLALSGCAQKTATTGDKATDTKSTASDTFTFAQGADPRGLDPARVDDLESGKVIVNLYEGLTKYAADSTDVEPCLAESWEVSDDGLKYTFKLRQGVKFHDGTEFNADAVKFNIDRQLPPKVDDNMPYASFCFGTVKEVKVVDASTVEIELTQPNTAFLANLAMGIASPIVSPAALEKSGNNSVMETPVGTGPYKFVKWNKGENVVLVRNDDYWGEKAKTKNVIFRIIADNSARVLALNNGEVDMIDGIDATVVDKIKEGGNELYEAPGMNVNYMAFNTTTKTFKDAAARKAVAQSINKEELVKSLYQGYSEVANTILPTFMPGYDAGVQQVAYDAAASKAELAKLGIKKVHMITYSNPRPYNAATGSALATAIQGYLQKVGVEATIDTYDWTTYKDKVKAGDYDMAFYGWIGDNGDPDNFLNLLADKDPNLNIARYDDATYKDMIKKALATPNGDDRNAQYAGCEKYVAERAVWVPFSHAKTQAAYRPGVSGFVYHVTGSVFLSGVEKK